MTIGIGGAGGRLAVTLDPNATIVNVSQTEMEKTGTPNRLLAVVHASQGQLRGSRKDPQIGREAYLSVKRELLSKARDALVFSSTGGGTGSGISAAMLEDFAATPDIPTADKTRFAFLLPHADREPAEYIDNTLAFIRGPLSVAIDSGNTGNIFLFTNRVKFSERIPEAQYNRMLIDSLRTFLAIPGKGERLPLLDGHIDPEDFAMHLSRPYFNHFTYFEYDPKQPFEEQLQKNPNPFLLPPDRAIEALFLLEVPQGADPRPFYDIIEYFTAQDVTPAYMVVESPERHHYFLTISLLYSRKPAELVEDFNRISQKRAQAKVKKSLDQHIRLPALHVNLEDEAKKEAKQRGASEEDILAVLRRIGKL